MRSIFRKLDRGQNLDPLQYEQLMKYLEDIGRRSPQSYLHFYNQYAAILEQEYATSLPRFWYGLDDLLNFLLSHQDSIPALLERKKGWEAFPVELHPYLKYTFDEEGWRRFLRQLLAWFINQEPGTGILPKPREGDVVFIYEDANPYKELGLKRHFDRLARYSFISRLQSYRYLTRSKARSDRFEVIGPDKLGGIFTNKEKSLYYFVFLSEYDPIKAENACQALNMAFGDFSSSQGEFFNGRLH